MILKKAIGQNLMLTLQRKLKKEELVMMDFKRNKNLTKETEIEKEELAKF